MSAPIAPGLGIAEVTLYREVDALGGAVEDAWGEGYSAALTDVLAILSRRGFNEQGDPISDALVRLAEAGRTAWHFQHRDTNAQLIFACALTQANAALRSAAGSGGAS